MSATAALSAATVGEFATQGGKQFVAMTAALAITTGLAALVAAWRGSGSWPTHLRARVEGLHRGLALTIMGQLPALLGVEKGSGNFFAKLWDLITELGDTSATTLLVGVLSLLLVLGLKRVAPAFPPHRQRRRRWLCSADRMSREAQRRGQLEEIAVIGGVFGVWLLGV
jgi:sulfate permease, SulP family